MKVEDALRYLCECNKTRAGIAKQLETDIEDFEASIQLLEVNIQKPFPGPNDDIEASGDWVSYQRACIDARLMQLKRTDERIKRVIKQIGQVSLRKKRGSEIDRSGEDASTPNCGDQPPF